MPSQNTIPIAIAPSPWRGEAFPPAAGLPDGAPSRLLKKPEDRLLTRAAQKRRIDFAGSYRAATVRERGLGGLFQQPARPQGRLAVILRLGCVLLLASTSHAQGTPQAVPENATMRVSDHVYAIIGFPNIAYVVGTRGTLVVDTGMGVKNGAIVVREAEKLAKAPNLYLTTTHFHPEHASGEQAFPPRTVLIRPAVQQQELENRGEEFLQMFRGFNAQFKDELKDVKFRAPDLLFDREIKLDLGGVSARIFWLGPAHTIGDELIMVEPDSALISGDIVQNKIVPNMPNADSNVKNWLAILDQLEPLKPRYVVPDHGALGDGSLIAKERAFLRDLQTRAQALKKQGTSADEAANTLTAEFKTKYPDWQSMGPVGNVVRRVYAETQ